MIRAGAPRWRFRALLASAKAEGSAVWHRLLALGAEVETHDQIYDAVAALADDPRAAHVLVVECDGFGGVDPVLRVIRRARDDDAGVPVILITRFCPEQALPSCRSEPVVLPSPVTAQALRQSLEPVLLPPAPLRLWTALSRARSSVPGRCQPPQQLGK